MFQLDIEKAKKDWELNRLKDRREEEERRAEMEEDDMLYTYTKDGMNQVQRARKRDKNVPKASATIEPSRKSKRPPMPKLLDSESEDTFERKPRKPTGRPRGRPKGSTKKSKQSVSTPLSNSITQQFLHRDLIPPVSSSPFQNEGVKNQRGLSPTPSDSSDVDIEISTTQHLWEQS